MNKIIQNSKERLAHLGGLAARTIEAERNILKSAVVRLAVVQKKIEESVGVDGGGDKKESDYLSLIHERGQLNIVIDKARAALSI